jgi:hypothetical protein
LEGVAFESGRLPGVQYLGCRGGLGRQVFEECADPFGGLVLVAAFLRVGVAVAEDVDDAATGFAVKRSRPTWAGPSSVSRITSSIS